MEVWFTTCIINYLYLFKSNVFHIYWAGQWFKYLQTIYIIILLIIIQCILFYTFYKLVWVCLFHFSYKSIPSIVISLCLYKTRAQSQYIPVRNNYCRYVTTTLKHTLNTCSTKIYSLLSISVLIQCNHISVENYTLC